MVTYSELFQYTLVIIGIIGLVIAANKKKSPPGSPTCGYFFVTHRGATRLPAAPFLYTV